MILSLIVALRYEHLCDSGNIKSVMGVVKDRLWRESVPCLLPGCNSLTCQ